MRAAPVWLETVRQDLQYGARQLLRSPGFTAAATITLALGIQHVYFQSARRTAPSTIAGRQK